ncbi:NAD(P)-binding protein [Aspergillus taichungensis]|uniref:NAD(P)-binding protein n=1 Tax=Aspergillus taichungensis TaxID=482145 RepID=A0A2J5I241_9EURO|nr:NAD(P)-binding protein [Aspergillus taichungensis]
MHMVWNPPQDYRNRPVAILGAGVLGRRLGYNVRIRDPSPEQQTAGVAYVQENVVAYAQKTGQLPGKCQAFPDVKDAVENAWLVIEAVPEKIELKIATFAELEATTPTDCILASNSSSYKSSEMIERVSDSTKTRILNMHYYMPPANMIVELMTDGYTHEGLIPFMAERSKEAATNPYIARKESTGFIFNRLWAAVKREVLTILCDGVSEPKEIDSMWREMFVKGNTLPCEMMDRVGLDTVAFIENHYIDERGLSAEKTVDFLQKHYLDNGKLGNKSSKGGLYPPAEPQGIASSTQSKLLVLDLGLSAATSPLQSGEILELTTEGKLQRCVVPQQALPDGLGVDSASGRIFWTCMGTPGKMDGAVYSATLDGGDIRTIVAPGTVNTPKQLAVHADAQKIYFSDREGACVYRCGFDGTGLELLIDNRSRTDADYLCQWCVGVAVAPTLGRFYWTQKGPSKSGKGRLFSASIATPAGQSASSRQDVQCILGDLPEPIDLEIDETSRTLYWTDRGELPFGNSLNKVNLDAAGLPEPLTSSRKYEIVTRNLNEAIGLTLDREHGCLYITDLGGSIYRCNLDGTKKERLHLDDSRAFAGIICV